MTAETKMKLISGTGPETITVPLGLGSSSAQRRGKLWGDHMQRTEEVTANEHLLVLLDFYHHIMKPSYQPATSVNAYGLCL